MSHEARCGKYSEPYALNVRVLKIRVLIYIPQLQTFFWIELEQLKRKEKEVIVSCFRPYTQSSDIPLSPDPARVHHRSPCGLCLVNPRPKPHS
jgi:hypothetical protein